MTRVSRHIVDKYWLSYLGVASTEEMMVRRKVVAQLARLLRACRIAEGTSPLGGRDKPRRPGSTSIGALSFTILWISGTMRYLCCVGWDVSTRKALRRDCSICL
jgi:hypothetical protein